MNTRNISNKDFSDVVLQQGLTPGSNAPTSFRPIRPVKPLTNVDAVQIGNKTAFGNGTAGTAVTTTTQGTTGEGPLAPQTIVSYLKVNIGNQTFWLPLVQ